MILIGYHPTGVYRLYNPIANKIEISRDVTVLEDEHWNWDSFEQTNSEGSAILEDTITTTPEVPHQVDEDTSDE